jgi:hypothetical protein
MMREYLSGLIIWWVCPTETEDELLETIKLNIEMRTDFPRAAIFTPFPGTKIVDLAKDHGLLPKDFNFDNVPSTILGHTILDNINRKLVDNYLCLFQSSVIYPWLYKYLKRLVRLRPNPIYRAWFYAVYAYLHSKSEKRGFINYIKYIAANFSRV